MTEKRFTLFDDGETIIDNEKAADNGGKQIYWTVEYVQRVKLVELLNELHEENEKQKTKIRMLEQQSQRQINRNDRLHKDWDRLYQHLLDMGLMTDEEILKVLIE